APSALAVLRGAAGESLSRYPEPWSEALREALARYAGVRSEQILVGCGSDDVIDAAFRAFGEPGSRVAHPDPTFSMVPVFARGNVLMVRTLSKAFGLAGLRVGWAVGAPALIEEVAKARGPYKVSAPAERAACAALSHDLDWMRRCVADAIASRDRLSAALGER